MHKKRVRILGLWLAGGDYLLIMLIFVMAYFIRFRTLADFFENRFFGFLLFFLLAWALCTYVFQLYQKFFVQELSQQLGTLIRVLLFHLLLVVAFNGLIKTFFSRAIILYSYAFLFTALPFWRFAFNRLLTGYYRLGFGIRNVLLVGGEQGTDVIRQFESNELPSVKVLGYFGGTGPVSYNYLGRAADLFPYLENRKEEVDEIYCGISSMDQSELNRLIEFADNNLIRIILMPDAYGLPFSKLTLDFVGQQPVLVLRTLPLDDPLYRMLKRSFDLIFSLSVLVLVLSWLLPVVALLIRVDSKGPVFFRQKRSGLNNRHFWCYKFRTMRINDESDLRQAKKGDERITRVGRLLRRTSLDELPQFFNVLLGNMSVVGPRPHMLSHTEHYSKLINKFMLRHFVKPGITGLSQIMGLRGETTDPALMRNRIRIDIFYVENWSFMLDMKIVFLTVYTIFRGDKNAF